MNQKRIAVCAGAVFYVLFSSAAVLNQQRMQEPSWVLSERTVPVPVGAAERVRTALLKASAPDIAAARRYAPRNEKAWHAVIAAENARAQKAAQDFARRFSGTVDRSTVAGVPVWRVTPQNVPPRNRGRLFLHLHGGAYVFYGGGAGLREAMLIADGADLPVMSIDYRMPPEHPFPAALQDVVRVYRSLLEERPAASLALGGSSAGGGLALASVHRFIELGLELPAALFAGTPWADLSKTGDSLFTNEGIDRVLVTYDGILAGAAKLYAGGRDLKHPLISPVYGDFTGFPPTYLITGTRDLFLSDVARTHRKMRRAGVAAELNVYEGVSHGEYGLELKQSYGELGMFLSRHLR